MQPFCFTDVHHEYWPKADYEAQGQLAARWRNLGINTVRLCRAEHNAVHATTEPPEMPSREQMIDDLAATDEYLSRPIRGKVARSLARRAIVDNLQSVMPDLPTGNAQAAEI